MSSKKADVRLGPELLAAVEAFKAENNIETMSAAMRALIQLGLTQSGALDAVWRRIAWREGSVKAQGAFKAAFAEAMHRVLSEAP